MFGSRPVRTAALIARIGSDNKDLLSTSCSPSRSRARTLASIAFLKTFLWPRTHMAACRSGEAPACESAKLRWQSASSPTANW